MKALSILQPYAELILRGEKFIENRTWETKYRGGLVIHTGKSDARLNKYDPCQAHLFPPDGPPDLFFGGIVGLCELVECVHIETLDPLKPEHQKILDHKHTEGPWCWVLDKVVRVGPIRYRGHQGLFEIEECYLYPLIIALSPEFEIKRFGLPPELLEPGGENLNAAKVAEEEFKRRMGMSSQEFYKPIEGDRQLPLPSLGREEVPDEG